MKGKKHFGSQWPLRWPQFYVSGGALILYNHTEPPEEYVGGTVEINFDEGITHTAGDAVLIPAPNVVLLEDAEEDTDASENADTENDDEYNGMGKGTPDGSKTKGRKTDSVVLTRERPEYVWPDEQNSGYTTRTQFPAADSIGTLKIPSIGLTVNAYDSADTMEDMDKGVSHFQSTSYWDGNVGMAGHNGNRAYSFFGKLHKVKVGDTITYTTELGTRTYVVANVWTISDDDWSHLERTDDNRLTLITCVADASKRLCVQAVEQ